MLGESVRGWTLKERATSKPHELLPHLMYFDLPDGGSGNACGMTSAALARPLPGGAHSLADQVERLFYCRRAGHQGNMWPEVTRHIQGDFILRWKERGALFSNIWVRPTQLETQNGCSSE